MCVRKVLEKPVTLEGNGGIVDVNGTTPKGVGPENGVVLIRCY